MWPALFIVDITHDVNNVSGDWQWGGAPGYVLTSVNGQQVCTRVMMN
jgi:hypothetical protein